jgi:hypothetical protein
VLIDIWHERRRPSGASKNMDSSLRWHHYPDMSRIGRRRETREDAVSSNKGSAHVQPTVVVTESGDIAAGGEGTGYRRGFADLLDLTSPPVNVAVLPPGAPTTIGFIRTGRSILAAMSAFRKTER